MCKSDFSAHVNTLNVEDKDKHPGFARSRCCSHNELKSLVICHYFILLVLLQEKLETLLY